MWLSHALKLVADVFAGAFRGHRQEDGHIWWWFSPELRPTPHFNWLQVQTTSQICVQTHTWLQHKHLLWPQAGINYSPTKILLLVSSQFYYIFLSLHIWWKSLNKKNIIIHFYDKTKETLLSWVSFSEKAGLLHKRYLKQHAEVGKSHKPTVEDRKHIKSLKRENLPLWDIISRFKKSVKGSWSIHFTLQQSELLLIPVL